MRPHITLAVLTLGLPFAARADITGNATLSASQGFSFDSGTASGASDLVFTGSGVVFQSGAKGGVLPVGTGSQAYSFVTQPLEQSLASFSFSTSQIAASALPVDTIVGIQTKGGNYAKFIVTAISSSSFAFQFTTFGVSGGGGAGAPTITSILNNSSTIPVGFSNSGVAPSTLFVIKGTGMATPGSVPVLQDSTKGLPTTLNGSSLSVSAGGNTYTPAIYYSSPTQIAAVLPAAVPVGQATLTVSYNGTPSAAASFTVVQTAYGISNYNGNTAVVQDAVSGALITPTSSAKPGQVIIIWGTGLGSDPADSDTTYTSSPHAISVSLKAYIGGVPVTDIAYAGQSVYPGVHVIGLTIPPGVLTGCVVPVIIVTGNNIVSNTPTMPVMANGGTCSDPDINANGDLINLFNTKPNVKVGSLQIAQLVSGATTSNIAQASFSS